MLSALRQSLVPLQQAARDYQQVLVGNNLRVREIHQNLRRAELRRLQEEEEGILVSLEARIVKILEKKTHNFGPNGHNATQKMPGA